MTEDKKDAPAVNMVPSAVVAASSDSAPAEDETQKVLQKLLGIGDATSQLKAAITEGIADLKKELVSDDVQELLAGAVYNGVKQVMEDEELAPKVQETMAAAVSSGMKKVLDDETYVTLVINVLGDSLVHFLSEILTDPESEALAHTAGVKLFSDSTVKGSFAEAAYHGGKRILEDVKTQKVLAGVANMIIDAQPFPNRITTALEKAGRQHREFFTSEQFKEMLAENRDDTISKLQDTINVCLSESTQDLRNLKFTLSVQDGGPEPKKEGKGS